MNRFQSLTDAPYNWGLEFFQFPIKKDEGDATVPVVSWIEMGALDPMMFISHVFAFENTLDAFNLFMSDKLSEKIVVKF